MSNVWTHRLLGLIGAPQAGSDPSPAPSNEPKFKRPFVEGPSVAELYQGIQAKIEAIRTSDEASKIIAEYQFLKGKPVSYLNTLKRKEAYHKLEAIFRTAFAEELEACVTKELNETPRRDPKGLTAEERNELTPEERKEYANAIKDYNRDPKHPLSDQSYEKKLRDDFREGIWEEAISAHYKPYGHFPHIHSIIAELLGDRGKGQDSSWKGSVWKDGEIDIPSR